MSTGQKLADSFNAGKPTSFDDTKVAKLRKRIHLPPELAAEVHEERFIVSSLSNFLESYNHKNGWSWVFMNPRIAIVQAVQKEVILRRHPKLGNFILFRIWKDGNK